MRLVLRRNVSPRNSLIKIVEPSNERISRISLYIEPTEHEKQFGWTENLKDLPTIISEFVRASIPAQSHVYGLLIFPIDIEYTEMLDEFREEALPTVTDEISPAKKSRWFGWLQSSPTPFTIRVANLTSERVARLYENYDDWRMVPYIFLISTMPIDNWPDVVGSLKYPKLVGEELLKKYGNLLTNIWEHGVELIGLDLIVAEFKSLAISLSQKLGAEFEFREQRLSH